MYGYKEYIPLTAEEILKRVDQKEIFKITLKKDIVVDKEFKYKAPYRNDIHPDCYFEEYQGVLYFVDFADISIKSKNCFNFISRCLNLSYIDTLQYINDHLKLGLGNSSNEVKEIIVENGPINVEEINKEFKKSRTITYFPRKFNYKDKLFWSKYEISMQNLIDDKVIPIDIYRSTNRLGETFTNKSPDIMYAYTDFDDNRVKIYRPKTKIKTSKWFTNCTKDDVGNINNIPSKGNTLIITKSYKDCRVLRNQGLESVIWFQNEGMIPNEKILKQLCKRFNEIYIWFDNDQTGLANGKFVAEYINSLCPNKAKFIFIPPKLLKEYNIKDPSDLIATLGKEHLLDFIKSKKLIKNEST